MTEGEATTQATPYAPGARVEVRDAEWMVRTCTPAGSALDGHMIRAVGVSEFVRGEDAVFFTGIDDVALLAPEDTRLVHDPSSEFARTRLFLESVLRRTPLPQSERRLAMPGKFLVDDRVYQQRPAELALKALRPRVLIADVVGLGKTLEIGLTLAELIRRGRGERILVVTPQQVLEQFQQELWTRFAIPLVRLDSVGLERVQRDIPAGRNPFLYFKRAIISIDTLKNQGKYGQHLRNMQWDAVVIDESHNLINEGNQRNQLARLLAAQTDALLLASATPHNGDPKSFAQLIRLLDPAAIADPSDYGAEDIDHLYIRRTKVNPEVRAEVGDEWPDRGPSESVRCAATIPEEKVFAELTEWWLPDQDGRTAPAVRKERQLFPFTLFKAFLSSHTALAATVANRLDTITSKADGTNRVGTVLKEGEDECEHAALLRLAELADEIDTSTSAKFQGLLTQLREIGVARNSSTRAVVFSESVPTLGWLHENLPEALGLKREQVVVMHGGLSDTEQQRIIRDFSLSDSKVRVLVTGDVASEGVNLHRQCHHLVHYDLPWSLIRIEQRNGRIDRYGQQHVPRFKALILTSATEGAKDDTTVAEKLLDREEKAHRAIGTAEAETGLFNAKKEEDRLILDLLAGRTVEESLQAQQEETAGDLFDDIFAGDVGVPEGAAVPERAPEPQLFDSTEQFVRAALDTVARDVRVDDDGLILAFEPPKDLIQRLELLPRDYLRELKIKDRLRVTFDSEHAQARLDEARATKTTWPDTSHVNDLHPLVEWLVDKVQVQTHRNQAPVITADVDEPVFLVQGTYSNELGQPTVVEWMAVTGLPDAPRVEDMFEAVRRAGVGPGMVNTGREGDLSTLQESVPAAVRAARAHLEERSTEYTARIEESLAAPQRRLEQWRQLSLTGLGDDTRAQRRKGEVHDTVAEQERLMLRMSTAGEPLLRVLAVVKGEN